MEQQVLAASGPSYRNTGWAAIISGVVGILAFGLLLDATLTRVSWVPSDRIYLVFNTHDIGVALQFFLLILVPFGLRTLSQQSPPGFSKVLFRTGVGGAVGDKWKQVGTGTYSDGSPLIHNYL